MALKETSSSPLVYGLSDSDIQFFNSRSEVELYSTPWCYKSRNGYLYNVYVLLDTESSQYGHPYGDWTWMEASGEGGRIIRPDPINPPTSGQWAYRQSCSRDTRVPPVEGRYEELEGTTTEPTGDLQADLDACESDRRALQSQLTATQDELGQVRNSYDQCSVNLNDCNDNIADLEAELSTLEGELATALGDLERANERYEACVQQLAGAPGQDTINQLQNQIDNLMAERDTCLQDLQTCQQQGVDQSVIDELNNEIARLEQELTTCQGLQDQAGNLEAMTNLYNQEKARADELQRRLDACLAEGGSSDELRQCQADLQACREEGDAALKACQAIWQDLQLQLEECRSALNECNSSYVKKHNQYEQCMAQLGAERERANGLAAELAACRKELEGGRGYGSMAGLILSLSLSIIAFFVTRRYVENR